MYSSNIFNHFNQSDYLLRASNTSILPFILINVIIFEFLRGFPESFFLIFAFIAWRSAKYSFEKRKWALLFFVSCATVHMLGVHMGVLNTFSSNDSTRAWMPKLLKVSKIL